MRLYRLHILTEREVQPAICPRVLAIRGPFNNHINHLLPLEERLLGFGFRGGARLISLGNVGGGILIV